MITLRMFVLKMLKSLEKLEEVGKILFEWFLNIFLKAKTDKHHLIVSFEKPFSINSNKKLVTT